MKVVNVYEQYFHAEAEVNGILRHAALTGLQAVSNEGRITYHVFVNFFPFNDPEDFAVTYDAYLEKEIYSSAGRRSRKREKLYLESFRETADLLAEELGGKIFWEQPLREARTD